MARVLDGAIAELAPKTLGLLSTHTLDAAGITRQQRRTLVMHGMLSPVGPGVLRHRAYPESWEPRVLAAVMVAGPGALASHMAAAALWRFDGIGTGAVEVTVPRRRRPRAVPGKVHRTVDLGPADVARRHAIPCTSAARTLIDIAHRLEERALETALDGAERDGKIWRPQLRWRIDRMRRDGVASRPGLTALERLLDRTDSRPLGDSWLEQEVVRIIADEGVPMPRVQVTHRHSGGKARVDLWWDEAKLVTELAGHGSHSTRRERQADSERAARLGLEGFEVLTFVYEDVVERPAYVVDMIRRHLARRTRARGGG